MTSMPVAGLRPSRGDERADLVVRNARIHTGDPRRPAASALTVRGGRIGVVGECSTTPRPFRRRAWIASRRSAG
ncbi:hypothetical protein, partial [Streptomyces sp. FH025]|uniref:hypothetical protein n=1 Tax=Streptomyces sp. FH025 TaxID=2815937 RepID=UPI001A9D59F3